MSHDRDERFIDYYRPVDYSKKNIKKICPKNTRVIPKNSKEDQHLSVPINKKTAMENVMRNENPFVTKYYASELESPLDKTDEEEEILNSIIDEEDIVENFGNTENRSNINKFKDANKCASHLMPYVDENTENEIPRLINKNMYNLLKNKKSVVDIIKCDPSRLDNFKMYKKVEQRIAEKYNENNEPKTINQVFNESILDFKKINPKLNKNEEERIQGKFKINNNIGSSFSFFNQQKEITDTIVDNIIANEGQFESHSTL